MFLAGVPSLFGCCVGDTQTYTYKYPTHPHTHSSSVALPFFFIRDNLLNKTPSPSALGIEPRVSPNARQVLYN